MTDSPKPSDKLQPAGEAGTSSIWANYSINDSPAQRTYKTCVGRYVGADMPAGFPTNVICGAETASKHPGEAASSAGSLAISLGMGPGLAQYGRLSAILNRQDLDK